MRSVRPLHDYILLRPVTLGDQLTAGGLHIPEVAREQPCEGHVVAMGSEVDIGFLPGDDAPEAFRDLRDGDLVLYQRFSATEVQANGETLLLLKVADIMAVLEGEHEIPRVELVHPFSVGD